MLALIMAGGSGTRFWPLSRKNLPKQYLNLGAGSSLIAQTAARLHNIVNPQDLYVVTTTAQKALVREHLSIKDNQIIAEPAGRNTAPCIGLALAYLLRHHSPDTPVLILPADHVITGQEKFEDSINIGLLAAQEDNLVTFGIKPTHPATGYGYIEAGADDGRGICQVIRFKEKPDETTAADFLAKGGFYWNSGMFLWKLGTAWQAYQQHLPELYHVLSSISDKWDTEGYNANISELYKQSPAQPVDIGIMEKAKNRRLVPVDYNWSDVGSFNAVWELQSHDSDGNTAGDSVYLNSHNSFVHSNKKVVLIGLDNLVVVDTPDALLVTTREQCEKVKQAVELLGPDSPLV